MKSFIRTVALAVRIISHRVRRERISATDWPSRKTKLADWELRDYDESKECAKNEEEGWEKAEEAEGKIAPKLGRPCDV